MKTSRHGEREEFKLTDDAPERLKAIAKEDGLFYFDFDISEPLPEVGNIAARNAILLDDYAVDDEPFFYGHIGVFGYVIAKKHLIKT